MRRKNDLLFRASTTALALGGITLSASPVWADNTAECNIGSFVNPANGLIISDLTSVECGINSNADGADTTAIGSDSTATADEATAVGADAQATAIKTVALGSDAHATKEGAIAIGFQSEANSTNAIVIGNGAKDLSAANSSAKVIIIGDGASSNGGIAIGSASSSSGGQSMAIGLQAKAGSSANTAIGALSEANGIASAAYGQQAKVLGADFSTAMGSGALVDDGADNSVALGFEATVTKNSINSLAIGRSANASEANSSAIGFEASADAGSSLAIGGSAKVLASAVDSVAIGNDSIADEAGTVSVGNSTGAQVSHKKRRIVNLSDGINAADAATFGQLSTLADAVQYFKYGTSSGAEPVLVGTDLLGIGAGTEVVGDAGVAIGHNAKVIGLDGFGNPSSDGSIAMGRNALVNGSASSVVIGDGAKSELLAGSTDLLFDSVAIGKAAHVAAESAISIGSNSLASGVQGVALGDGANAQSLSSISIGTGSSSGRDGIQGIAIGVLSDAAAENSIALGVSTITAEVGSVAIGNRAEVQKSAENSVALGAGSIASRKDVVSFGNDVEDIDGDGNPLTNPVFQRQLVNVADGTEATDAVNVRQLDAVDDRLVIAELDIDALQAESRFLTVNSNALAGAAVANGADGVALGSGANVNANATNGVALGKDATINAGITNSVALGAGSVASASNTVSVGKAGSERKITNLAQGVADTDAVNVQQLTVVDDRVDVIEAKTKYLSVNSTLGVASATGTNAIALGPVSTAVGNEAVSIGNGSNANGIGSVAMGPNASIIGTATAGIALGQGAKIEDRALDVGRSLPTDAIVIGQDSVARDKNAIAIGHDAVAEQNDTIAMGREANAIGAAAIAMGERTQSTGVAALAFGINARSLSDRALAIGADSFALGEDSIAIGIGLDAALANGQKDLNGDGIFEIFERYGARGDSAIAIGRSSLADSVNSTAIGVFSIAGGIGSSALGSLAFANGNDSIAVGAATADGRSSVAMGFGAFAQEADGVAIGSGSVANRGNAVSFGNDDADIDGDGNPLTNPIFQRQLINVADGTQDTDAVNLRQLNIVDDRVVALELAQQYLSVNSTDDPASANGEDAIALGEETSASALNSIAIGKTSNVGAGSNGSIALGADSQVTDGTVNAVALGANSIANEKDTVSIGTTLVGGQRRLVNLADGTAPTDAVNVRQLNDLRDDLTNPFLAINSIVALAGDEASAGGVNSIALGALANATGNNSVALGAGSVVAAGVDNVVSVGSSTLQRKIINVAAGNLVDGSTDAVNADQLVDEIAGVNLNITNLGDTIGDQITDINTSIGGIDSRVTVVEGDITDINTSIANITADTKFLAVGSADIAPAALAGGLDAVALGAGANASAANSVAIGAGSIADRVIASGVGQPVGTVSFGTAGAERQLVHVADGTQATDAVNKRQLDVVDAKTKYLSIKSTAAAASASGVDSVAIGGGAATGLLARDGIAIGSGAQVNIDNAIAMGNLATVDATAKGAIAIGAGAKVFARDTDSAQPGVQETVDLPVGAIAFGNTAQATEKEAISIGSGIANRKEAISIGQQNIVNGANSIAIGKSAQTAFEDSIAMGRNANTLFAGGVAIGRAAQALTPDSVALGSDSNTGARSDVVSIGSDGTISGSIVKTRQLTNLKAGTQATDAVNKGQMDSELDKIREDLGGDITNITTDVTTATNTIINEKTKYLAVNSAGTDAAATGAESIAVGGGSSVAAGVNGGIALGSNAKVNAGALNSVAIGAGSIADRVPVAGTAGTVSIGTTATGGQRQLVNVADGTQATDAVNKRQLDAAIQDIDVRNPFLAIDSTVAIAADDEAFASGGDAMALGKSARAEAQQGLALGFAANVVGQRGIALGSNASASGTDSVALGANSIANRGNAVSVGSDSLQRQIINVAAGTAATDAVNKAQLDDVERKIATFDGKIGDQITNINTTVQAAAKAAPWTSINSVEGEDGVAEASGEDAIALGKDSRARGNDTVAIGNGAIAEGDASVSVGKGNRASGKGAVAIGDPNVASGTGAFAGGDENRAIGDGALALGNLNKAFGKSAIALGDNATAGAVQIDSATGLAILDPVTGDPIPVNSGNIAIGDAASATNTDNIAIGSGAKVNVANAMALGKGATVGAAGANSIALGNGSIANEANVLSVGAVGAERKIVNVATGLNANDAVNVAQLTQAVQGIIAGVNPFFITSSTSGKATVTGLDSIALGKDATTNGDNSVALGTGSVADEDDVVSVGAAGAERKIINVAAGAINEFSTDAVNGAQLFAEVNRAITQSVNPFVTVNSTGGKSTATGTDAIAIGKESFATGEKGVALGQGATVDAAARNSVALGAGSVVAADQSNTVSVGAVGAERKIVNVADGRVERGSKDAVNGGQLAEVRDLVTNVTRDTTTALERTQYLEVNSTGTKPKATGEDAIALGENANANSKDALAIGVNANATGAAALAIGAGSKSNGAGAIALGNGASSEGSLTVAIGNGASATKVGSVAIGQAATTTRENQIALGNTTTTVTMAGLGSAASAAAQTGTTKFVTGDSLGNLAYSTFSTADIANLQKSVADLTGQFSTISTQIEGLGRRAREADGGIAAAMALGGTMLLPDTSVSVSFNLATYRGEQGFSGAVVAKVRENVWVSGGIGGSTVKRSTGGRVGISFGW